MPENLPPLPPPGTPPPVPLPQGATPTHDETLLTRMGKLLDIFQQLWNGVVIVVVIAVVGLIVQFIINSDIAAQNLSTQVAQQNGEIDALMQIDQAILQKTK